MFSSVGGRPSSLLGRWKTTLSLQELVIKHRCGIFAIWSCRYVSFKSPKHLIGGLVNWRKRLWLYQLCDSLIFLKLSVFNMYVVHKSESLWNAMRFIFCGWKKTTLSSVTKALLRVPSRIAPSFTMNIATLTMKKLDVSDFTGACRTGGVWTCEWDGSWFSISLQLLLGEHLRLPVRIHQSADLCWHLKDFRWKSWKKRM